MAGVQNSTEAKNLTAAWDAIKQIPKDSLTAGQTAELLAKAKSGEALLSAIETIGTSAASVVQGAIATVDDNAKKAQQAKPIDSAEKKQLELDLKNKGTAEAQDMLDKLELYLAEADPAQGELPLDNPNSLGAKAKRGLGNLASKAKGAVAGAASKAKGAVAGAASDAVGAVKQGAKDLGNKVTANKLVKAWQKAGEPLDTGSIMNIMQGAGLSNDQIGQIGQAQKIKLDAPVKQEPKADAPTPKADAPQADTPQADAPQADTPQADAPQADTPQADAPAPAAGQSGKVIPMPKKDTSGKINPKIKVAKGAGQIAKAKDGQNYVWAGAQWVNNGTGRMATKDIAAELGNPVLTDLANRIKKAGPEITALVVQQLGQEQKVAASIDIEVDNLIAELDKALR
jgi:hypothetical protein